MYPYPLRADSKNQPLMTPDVDLESRPRPGLLNLRRTEAAPVLVLLAEAAPVLVLLAEADL